MGKITKAVKEKVDNNPKMFLEAPLLIIALNFMTIGGIMISESQLKYGFMLLAFSAVLVVLQKYIEGNEK